LPIYQLLGFVWCGCLINSHSLCSSHKWNYVGRSFKKMWRPIRYFFIWKQIHKFKMELNIIYLKPQKSSPALPPNCLLLHFLFIKPIFSLSWDSGQINKRIKFLIQLKFSLLNHLLLILILISFYYCFVRLLAYKCTRKG
jgi:hypothetical protein